MHRLINPFSPRGKGVKVVHFKLPVFMGALVFFVSTGCSKPQESASSEFPGNPKVVSEKDLEESNRTIVVVQKVLPTVVSIHSEKIVEVPDYQYFNPFEEFFNFYNPRHPYRSPHGTPEGRKFKQQGLGSGVIISSEGHIITNHHVAGEADNIRVTLTDDREFEAQVVGSDKLSDVAVLKIKNPPKDLPVAPLGNSDNLQIGETVLAIGNPFGYSNTVTKGILSARGRSIGINSYENYLQTDASINPGNSGGALVNLQGELIGINTAIASKTGASHGIGFAIPINMAKKIKDDLISSGHAIRGYLGVYLQEVDGNLAQALGLKKSEGALINNVIESSPAEKSGLNTGDVIISVDGKKVKDVNGARNQVALIKPGKTIEFEVVREGKIKKLQVKIGKREEDIAGASPKSDPHKSWGLQLESLNEGLARQYQLEVSGGVLVTDVRPGSSGDHAGFLRGDVILEVSGTRVGSPGEFRKSMAAAGSKSVLIKINRRGGTQFLGLAKED